MGGFLLIVNKIQIYCNNYRNKEPTDTPLCFAAPWEKRHKTP